MPEGGQPVSLDGTWELLPTPTFRGGYYSDATWLTMEVPSHWQQHPALEHHAGRVVYRKRFELVRQPGRRYRLRLNGVFYFYIAYLNGFRLGENEGYFFPREFDITQHLKAHALPNELIVEVECADEESKQQKKQITGVFSHWDCLDPQTNPGGIWRTVEILESGPQYIGEIRLTPTDLESVARLAGDDPPQKVELRADIVANSDHPAAPVYRITFTPYNFDGDAQAFAWRASTGPGDNRVNRFFALERPRLWWTHDLGEPALYTVRVETFGDEMLRSRHDMWEFRWGLRRFELRDWIPHLNGVRLFLKGSNYPPGDTRIAVTTRDDYVRDLRLARDAHMNFMRVHAHIEKPEFYQAADEMGFLLWQDFPLQWGYARQVLPQAERQAALMVATLYNHPSVGIWCMHNEPIFIADTNDTSLGAKARSLWSTFVYSWDREVMDGRLKAVAEHADPTRPVIRSSGEWAFFRRRGTDGHFYFGWYSGLHGPKRRFEIYKRLFPRALGFVTEFGAQSFPNYESCLKFMDTDIHKIDWRHLAERHHFQPQIMSDWLPWHQCQTLAELIALTQDYQIEINQYYIDWLRFHKYRPCGGFAPFLFLDSNPAVQWSIVDYWRVPKKSYEHMQAALYPEYVFTLRGRDSYRRGATIELPVYAVNDSRQAYPEVQIQATLYGPGDTVEWQSGEYATSLEADCMAKLVSRVAFRPAQAGLYCLNLDTRLGSKKVRNAYRLRIV